MLSFAIRISLVGTVWLVASPDPALAQGKSGPGKKVAEIFTRFASDLMTGVVVPYIVDQLPKPESEPVQEETASPQSMPQAPAQAPASATGNYSFDLEWTAQDGLYSGTLAMSGARGLFRVHAPGGLTIDQDMEAVRFQGTIWLLASNLRYAPGTTGPEGLQYWPDNFRLVQGPGGEWAITETCDAQNEGKNCSPVRILSARPF